jgi:phosphatidylglycerophosphate synthase
MLQRLPFALILMRLALAPLILLMAYYDPEHKAWIAVICYVALISDIIDGIIARHAGVATQSLRLWDSNVDLVFWLCACWCIWICFPAIIISHLFLVIPLLLLEWIPDTIYFIRFRKFGCAHNYASKTFGLFLLATFTALFVFNYSGWLFTTTIVIGLLAEADRILIACILPARVCDVPSFYHAQLMRKGIAFKKYKLFHS